MDVEGILKKHGYEIGDFLGKGSYGACYKVFSSRYNMDFACKVIFIPDDYRKKSIVASLKSEIEALCQIDDVNVIKIYEFFEEEHNFFLILEYCDKGSISDLIKNGKRIPPNQLRHLVRQIISALKFCHSNSLSHLDIKPGNILLCSGNRVKVADFGLSRFIKDGEKTNVFLGSLIFEAPEIIAKHEYDPFKADVWSFGITVYMMATGELPFDTINPNYIKSQISMAMEYSQKYFSPDMFKIVKCCLRVNPENRPTFNEINDMLQPDLYNSRPSLVKPFFIKGNIVHRCQQRKPSPVLYGSYSKAAPILSPKLNQPKNQQMTPQPKLMMSQRSGSTLTPKKAISLGKKL